MNAKQKKDYWARREKASAEYEIKRRELLKKHAAKRSKIQMSSLEQWIANIRKPLDQGKADDWSKYWSSAFVPPPKEPVLIGGPDLIAALLETKK